MSFAKVVFVTKKIPAELRVFSEINRSYFLLYYFLLLLDVLEVLEAEEVFLLEQDVDLVVQDFLEELLEQLQEELEP